MSDGDYCDSVVIGVSNESSPSYDFWEEVKICYKGVFMSIPLSREGWALGAKDYVSFMWGVILYKVCGACEQAEKYCHPNLL